MSTAEMEIIIHAFIFFRLDYCNSFTCLGNSSLKRLQVVKNAAAKLLISERSHVTPILNNDNNL